MRTEDCREWRISLGAYALGQLDGEDRIALEAHLERCPECRAEAEALGSVGRLLSLADPDQVMRPAPRPPAELGERIAAQFDAERAAAAVAEDERRAAARTRRRRRRFGFALGGGLVAATAAVVLALVLTSGGGAGQPEQHVAFANVPKGIEIAAVLEPHAYGTEIHMYVHGVRSGTLCRVFLRGDDGKAYPAGSFRYRWGEDSDAVLSSALDLSSTRAVGVHAGGHTFIAPVDRGATASTAVPNEEEAT